MGGCIRHTDQSFQKRKQLIGLEPQLQVKLKVFMNIVIDSYDERRSFGQEVMNIDDSTCVDRNSE